MTNLQQAFRLYKQYKTSTNQYKELAALLGFSSPGELNKVFHCRINKLDANLRRA